MIFFRLLALPMLLLAVAAALLGPAHAEDTEMIVGGKPAADGKYPFQIRIYESMDDQKGICGGTLISDQWVLTAAHCAVDNPAKPGGLTPVDKLVVGYGSNDRTKTTKIESEKIIVHPDYLANGFASGADIALIKLAQPVSTAKPVEVATSATEEKFMTLGAKATVTGWGAIWDPEDKEIVELLSKLTTSPEEVGDRLNFPIKLHEVDIEVMDRDECKTIYQSSQLPISDTEICAMKPRSVANSCYGDSGGPLMILGRDPKRYIQVGIVSWGDRCGRSGSPNVYTRVASFSDWISQSMGSN